MTPLARAVVRNSHARSALLLLVGLLVVLAFSRYVPYCMDEFLHYNEIIYGYYPYNRLNTFNEAPDLYDLNLYGSGLILPLRSYYYMGSLPSLYYFPLFLLWKSPLSARFLGIVFLFLQAFLLGRILRIRREWLFFSLLAFFPYLFQHLVETGLVGLQILLVLALYHLIHRWSRRPRYSTPLWMALIAFTGIWSKISFLWYGPALVVVLVSAVVENRSRWSRASTRSLLLQGAAGLILLLALLSILFCATDASDPSSRPYWDLIFRPAKPLSHPLGDLIRPGFLAHLPVFDTLWNPLRATERVFQPARTAAWSAAYSAVLYGATPLLWLLTGIVGLRETRARILRSMSAYAGFLLTLFMVIRTSQAWAMHHTLLAYPFLILAFLTAAKALHEAAVRRWGAVPARRALVGAVALFGILNLHYFVVFPKQTVDAENDASRLELNHRLQDEELAEDYFFVVLDWGMYFYQALYGNRKQSVLYIEPMFPRHVTALNELRSRYHRKLLFLYHPRLHGHDLRLLRWSFSLEPCNLTGTLKNDGSDWQVLIEQGPAPGVCAGAEAPVRNP